MGLIADCNAMIWTVSGQQSRELLAQPTWYTPLFRSRPTTFISLVLASIHPSTRAASAILSAQSSATGAHYLQHATTSVSRKLPRPAAAIACHEGTLIYTPSPRLGLAQGPTRL